MTDLTAIGGSAAAEAIREGSLTSADLVGACLERIAADEERVGAWTHLDPGHAMAQARAADQARREGRPLGPLHGVPVGIKDIFDTHDYPTENGTVLHAGRQPVEDATAVALLREAGAVILGKTVTTELAVFSPGKTRNPHDPTHTPGGSSSGSAAAVAAGMVPLAIGTQTNGSMIRPASFCGIFGFKPTWGRISRHRVLAQSFALDTVGAFGRSVDDVALLAEVLMAYDPRDAAMRPNARPRLLETARAEPPVPPAIAFVRTPVWDQAADYTHEAFEELAAALGELVHEVQLGPDFAHVVDWHRIIMETDLAVSFANEYENGGEHLSEVLRQMIERGLDYRAADYAGALKHRADVGDVFDEVFGKFDAILTPAVIGEAPEGLGSTGSPIFCTLWSYAGLPALSMPLLEGPGGLPLGVQLVGARGDDARLLRTARWLVRQLTEDES